MIYPRAIAETTEQSTDLRPRRRREKLRRGAQLVDVRQEYEWEAGRIPVPRTSRSSQLPARAGELDRDRPIVFQCRSGSRSWLATEAFRQAGHEAFNLEGGLLAWIEDGREVEPDRGEVAGPRPDAT